MASGDDRSALVAERVGRGPAVLLVHGGASPASTWSGVESLRGFSLIYVRRRGFESGLGTDFAGDAIDLERMLEFPAHLVAHSYGCLGALIATAQMPERVRSLTVLEPPLDLPAGDPEVARLRRMSDAVLRHGLDADPATLREFLRSAGSPGIDDGPLPPSVVHGVERALGTRPPFEARPDLAAIREAGVPTLVASGGHMLALERICDALAEALGGERVVAEGAGHFVAAAPGFVERLRAFLAGAERT